jgi:hypothetical protein
VGVVIAGVDTMLENLDVLLGDLSTPYPPNQFFGFATKHAATNNFYPSRMVFHNQAPIVFIMLKKTRQMLLYFTSALHI